jgi:thioredoxin 1
LKFKWPILLLLALAVIVLIVVKQEGKKNLKGPTKAQGPLLTGGQLAEALKNGRPTLADFGRDTCIPCKAMAPVLQQAAKDYQGKVNVAFVNLEDYPALGPQYRISVIPSQIVFDKTGKATVRHMGFLPKEDIYQKLKELEAGGE